MRFSRPYTLGNITDIYEQWNRRAYVTEHLCKRVVKVWALLFLLQGHPKV